MFSRSCCFRFLRLSCLARSARVILGPAPGGRSCLGARIARIHPNAHPLAASLSLLLLTPPIYFSSSSLLSQSSLEFLELDPILFRVSSPFILSIGPFLLHSNTCLPAAFHPICLRRRPPARPLSLRLRRERRVCILARRKHPMYQLRGLTGIADPNAPKRGLSAYMFFANENREKVREENPGISFGKIRALNVIPHTRPWFG